MTENDPHDVPPALQRFAHGSPELAQHLKKSLDILAEHAGDTPFGDTLRSVADGRTSPFALLFQEGFAGLADRGLQDYQDHRDALDDETRAEFDQRAKEDAQRISQHLPQSDVTLAMFGQDEDGRAVPRQEGHIDPDLQRRLDEFRQAAQDHK